MNKAERDWQVLAREKEIKNRLGVEEIVDVLLENRGLVTESQKQEFFNPVHPDNLSLADVGINPREVEKAIKRIKKSVDFQERIVVYGDYDADGVSGTAILWEALWGLKADVLPYIPERFSEGYGLNAESVKNLKSKYSLMIFSLKSANSAGNDW